MTTIEFDDYAFDEETCIRLIQKLSHLEFTIGYYRSGISCMLIVSTPKKMKQKDLRDIFFMSLIEFIANQEA